jgi:hypothetical protein
VQRNRDSNNAQSATSLSPEVDFRQTPAGHEFGAPDLKCKVQIGDPGAAIRSGPISRAARLPNPDLARKIRIRCTFAPARAGGVIIGGVGWGLLFLVVMLAPCLGCASLHRVPSRPCRSTTPIELEEQRPWVPTESGPEYDRLRPFRSYLRVQRVGPFAEHFTVSFLHIEDSQCEVEVVPRPGKPPLVSIRSGWTGSASREKIAPPPAHVRGLAEAAEAAMCRTFPNSSDVIIEYRGAYREIVVQEEVPYDRAARFGIPAEANLRATRDLGALDQPNGAFSALGRLAHYRPANPRWVDFVPPAELSGRCLLCATDGRRGATPAFWPDLARGILETARAVERADYRSPFEKLQSSQGEGLVPAQLDQVLELELSTHAGRTTHGRLIIPLRAHDAIFGSAAGSRGLELGGRRLRVEARLGAVSPTPRDQVSADHRLPLALVLRLADDRGNEVQRTLQLTARVHLERGRVGVQYVGWDGLNTPEGPSLRALALPPVTGSPEIQLEFKEIDNPR